MLAEVSVSRSFRRENDFNMSTLCLGPPPFPAAFGFPGSVLFPFLRFCLFFGTSTRKRASSVFRARAIQVGWRVPLGVRSSKRQHLGTGRVASFLPGFSEFPLKGGLHITFSPQGEFSLGEVSRHMAKYISHHFVFLNLEHLDRVPICEKPTRVCLCFRVPAFVA